MDSLSLPARYISSGLHLVIITCAVIGGLAICQNTDNHTYPFILVPSIDEVVHYEHESYIVSCQANDTRLRWLDPNNEWVDEHRGRIHVEQRNNESQLVFTTISLEDNGNWTCNAEKGDRKLSFRLIVYKPITFVDTPEVQSVKENTDAVIKCMVTGDPVPDLSWYYNGEPLNYDGKFEKIADGLSIKRVTKNNSGEYTCKAFQISSAFSTVKEQTIRLNILHKPMKTVHRESADIQYGYVRGYVNVTCEALADPPATFQWFRNNKPIKNHQIVNGEHVSYLQLHLNSSKFFGDYVCEAKNELGTLKRTISLMNGTKPPAPPHITLRGIASNTFDLDIGAKKTGKPDPMDIIGYRFELQTKQDIRNNGGKWINPRVIVKDFADGVNYLIKDLAANTTYFIRVASINAAGLSDWMGPMEFQTPEKAEHGTYSSVSHIRQQSIGMHFIHVVVVLGLWKLLQI